MTPQTRPVSIRLANAKHHAPLLEQREYGHYFDTYLWIDTRTRTARWTVSYETGSGMPMEVWHGIERRIACSPMLSNTQLIRLGHDLGQLVALVCDGSTVEWDGRNWVGVLDEDAQSALDEIETVLGREESDITAVHIGDWIFETITRRTREDIHPLNQVRIASLSNVDPVNSGLPSLTGKEEEDDYEDCHNSDDVVQVELEGVLTITDATSDEELEAAAEALEASAWSDASIVLMGTLEYLHELREECTV